MKKSSWVLLSLLIIVVIFILVYSFLAIREYKEGERLTEETFPKDLSHFERAERCFELPYGKAGCFERINNLMRFTNITFTQDYCDILPEEDSFPLWAKLIGLSKQENQRMLGIKLFCNCMVENNNEEVCKSSLK